MVISTNHSNNKENLCEMYKKEGSHKVVITM